MTDLTAPNLPPEESNDYIAGSCNIGKREIRRRQTVAALGALVTAFTLFSFYHYNVTRLDRLAIFFPMIMTSIGFLQARKRFCLAYGLTGLFNFGTNGKVQKVISPADRATDRNTAITLLFQSTVISILFAGVIFFLPIRHG